MEKAISSEERIRRAEEIYNRRRMQNGVRVSSARVNTQRNSNVNPKLRLYKKLIIQILTCFFIYLGFYLVKNSNYIFSESFISKTKEFLSYDINFSTVYNNVALFYNDKIKTYFEKINNNINEDSIKETNEILNETTNEIVNEDAVGDANESPGIGGGEDNSVATIEEATETNAEPVVQLSQMEIDANEIKQNHNFILPLEGVISSRYGPRQGSKIVSSNHAGIDIAVNEGTVFVAAMEGKVIVASSEGSYGKHIFIQDGDVITVYAHCKKLYVKEGEMVKQGQQLGEVGQTGNATGPHLHFEIRRDNRTVNPEMILSFA